MAIDETFHTLVIGGGQAGLAAGYYLSKSGGSGQADRRFLILDENERTGDSWRRRWDSLRLFTPSIYDGLPGTRFPRPNYYYPTKDEVADFLEGYAAQHGLPVRHQVKVRALTRGGEGFLLNTNAGDLRARNVIVATGPFHIPRTPPFARELDPAILQFHSSVYCNPQQLPAGNVLVVGAGNSGAEIGLDLARAGKHVWLAGRDVGSLPAEKMGKVLGGRPYWWLISFVLSVRTPIGRKMQARVLHQGGPLIRTNRKTLAAAGVEITPRVSRVQSGKPELEDGRILDAQGVVWATGFRPDYGWIDLPVFNEEGIPRHERGAVREAPGLYFLGMPFQTALSSSILGGVSDDARFIVRQIG